MIRVLISSIRASQQSMPSVWLLYQELLSHPQRTCTLYPYLCQERHGDVSQVLGCAMCQLFRVALKASALAIKTSARSFSPRPTSHTSLPHQAAQNTLTQRQGIPAISSLSSFWPHPVNTSQFATHKSPDKQHQFSPSPSVFWEEIQNEQVLKSCNQHFQHFLGIRVSAIFPLARLLVLDQTVFHGQISHLKLTWTISAGYLVVLLNHRNMPLPKNGNNEKIDLSSDLGMPLPPDAKVNWAGILKKCI